MRQHVSFHFTGLCNYMYQLLSKCWRSIYQNRFLSLLKGMRGDLANYTPVSILTYFAINIMNISFAIAFYSIRGVQLVI